MYDTDRHWEPTPNSRSKHDNELLQYLYKNFILAGLKYGTVIGKSWNRIQDFTANHVSEVPEMRMGRLGAALATVAGGFLLATGASAEPVSLSATQLDSVTAGGVETVDGFVCPVITTSAVTNSQNGGELGIEGYYTIGGPEVTVPVHATNDDGAGRPSGPFATPGDTDYTAIWGVSPQ